MSIPNVNHSPKSWSTFAFSSQANSTKRIAVSCITSLQKFCGVKKWHCGKFKQQQHFLKSVFGVLSFIVLTCELDRGGGGGVLRTLAKCQKELVTKPVVHRNKLI